MGTLACPPRRPQRHGRPGGCAAQGARAAPRQRPRLGRGRPAAGARRARERLPRGDRATRYEQRSGHRRGRRPEVGREARRAARRVRPPRPRTRHIVGERTRGTGEPPAAAVATAPSVAVGGVLRRVRSLPRRSPGDARGSARARPRRETGDVIVPARSVPLAPQARTRRASVPGASSRPRRPAGRRG